MSAPRSEARGVSRRQALRFILLLGGVSLLSDATYEGARSITGPFLAVLWATGTAVGVVAGLGELLGYGLRLASGILADRTRRYWAITIGGYCINLLAVPLLALAGRWETAAALMLAERAGKALRTPARDAMLSHAASGVGPGWGFGLHEALDQVGAIAGPLAVASLISEHGNYRAAFAWLLVPALLALVTLAAARLAYPRPQDLEVEVTRIETGGLPRAFWIYLAAAGLMAAGYADFPLMAYHIQKNQLMLPGGIALLYSLAMAVDAAAALVVGRIYDCVGLRVLAIAAVVSAGFAPLTFLGGRDHVIAGMVLWGFGMGAQESVVRAAVARMVPPERRGTAYGVFNAGYGACWFLGSALMGVLYDASVPLLVAFSLTAQLCAAGVFLIARRQRS